jgi:DNA repair protein RadC
MNHHFISAAYFLRVIRARAIQPRPLAAPAGGLVSIRFPDSSFVAEDPSHESEKEHLVTALLNAKLRLIGNHVVSVDSLSEAIAHPREIYRATILTGAYAHVLMHNHPSGNPAPSDADRRLTRKIHEAGQIMEISLLDHVIAGVPKAGCAPYFSFREVGFL